MRDKKGDTLIYASEASAGLRLLPSNRSLHFSGVKLEKALLKLNLDSAGNTNMQFFVDALKRKDSTKKRMLITFSRIELIDSDFKLYAEKGKNDTLSGVVNFNNLQIKDINLKVNELHKSRNSVTSFELKELSFQEKSGFGIENLKSKLLFDPHTMKFEDVVAYTGNSVFNAEEIKFTHDDYHDWSNGKFPHSVDMKMILDKSVLYFGDLAYFIPFIDDIKHSITLKADVSGKVEDLNIKGLSLKYGKSTVLQSNITLKGLPDIKNTFIFHEIQQFTTSYRDVNNSGVANEFEMQRLPKQLDKLGVIEFKGDFTGFLDDFVAYGDIFTGLGDIKTDIAFKPDTLKNMSLEGSLQTSEFDIGTLIGHDLVGKMSMDMHLDGILSAQKEVISILNGNINNIEINDYVYSNIKLNGFLTNENYDGSLIIKDRNIDLQFIGRIDYSKKIPEFDFNAKIKDANLHALNFYKEDTALMLSCAINAEFFSPDSSSLKGEVNLNDTRLSKQDKEIVFNDFRLFTSNTDSLEQIILRSDYIDGQIAGNYDFQSLSESIKDIFYNVLPGYFSKDYKDVENKNRFDLYIKLKETTPVTDFLFPYINIADSTIIEGAILPGEEKIIANIHAGYLDVYGSKLNDLVVETSIVEGNLENIIRVKKVNLTEEVVLENFKTTTIAAKDTISFSLRWFDEDEFSSAGSFEANGRIKKNVKSGNSYIEIDISPSSMVYKDSLWNIHASKIIIDSNDVTINHFKVNKKNQIFAVNGKLSENKENVLSVFFEDFSLSNFNLLTEQKGINVYGTVNGTFSLSDLYHEPLIETDFHIDTFIINRQKLGETYLNSVWNNKKKHLIFEMNSQRGNIRTLSLMGFYSPDDEKVKLDAELNKLRLDILNNYLGKTLADIKGIASGSIELTGTVKNPEVNGEVKFQKTSFTVDYLKTRYSFTHDIDIRDNNLIFDDINIYDEEGNKAYLSGMVSSKTLRNFELDLTLMAEDLMFMNTTLYDNEQFYGKAFASGVAKLKGFTDNLSIDISTETSENTNLFFPMYSSSEVNKDDFITFVSDQKQKESDEKDKDEEEEEYKVDLSGLDLDFDLEVTPDVNVQIILGSRMGDVINANGEGNLKLDVSKQGVFNIYGEYNITKGDYLFTLQNLINKKFEIRKGSKLIFNGELQNAEVDLVAVYKLKASLSNLFGDTTQLYRRRVPVECEISLQDRLINPRKDFSIKLPTVDAELQDQVSLLLSTDEKMIRQFLSLLVLNNFYPDPEITGVDYGAQGQTSGLGASSVGATTTELLSNQLGQWLSQISNDVDIGFNYRPGNEMLTDEVEVALSTHLLDERVSISGNLDVGGDQTITTEETNTSGIVGDFQVDVKLNKSGKLRVKAFNRENDNILYENSQYTQGVGVSYREEFNSFGSLMDKYWNIIKGKNREKNK